MPRENETKHLWPVCDMCAVRRLNQPDNIKQPKNGDDDELKINSKTMFNARIQNPLNKLKWWKKENVEFES